MVIIQFFKSILKMLLILNYLLKALSNKLKLPPRGKLCLGAIMGFGRHDSVILIVSSLVK